MLRMRQFLVMLSLLIPSSGFPSAPKPQATTNLLPSQRESLLVHRTQI